MKSPETMIHLAVEIVSSFVGNNSVPSSDLPGLLGSVHASLLQEPASQASPVEAEPQKPAVPLRKSVTDEFIVCLEDGRKFKSLKRHLRTRYAMSPEQYREKWGLEADYPMVAPAYAKARSTLAKEMGLGQQRRKR